LALSSASSTSLPLPPTHTNGAAGVAAAAAGGGGKELQQQQQQQQQGAAATTEGLHSRANQAKKASQGVVRLCCCCCLLFLFLLVAGVDVVCCLPFIECELIRAYIPSPTVVVVLSSTLALVLTTLTAVILPLVSFFQVSPEQRAFVMANQNLKVLKTTLLSVHHHLIHTLPSSLLCSDAFFFSFSMSSMGFFFSSFASLFFLFSLSTGSTTLPNRGLLTR
jgi:hypothetical protein